jgi:hypothetical protein
MADAWRRAPLLVAAGVLLVSIVGVAALLGPRRGDSRSGALSRT